MSDATAPTPNPFAGIDFEDRDWAKPTEIVRIAENVTGYVVGPVLKRMDEMAEMLRRIVGDSADSPLPPEYRHKGVINTIHESQENFYDEQRGWKAQQDGKDTVQMQVNSVLAKNQKEILDSLIKLEKRTATLEARSHKTRRTIVTFFRWLKKFLTTKDDAFSIFVGKLVLVAGLFSSSAFALYELVRLGIKWLAGTIHLILAGK